MRYKFTYKIDGQEVTKEEYQRRRKSRGVAGAVGAYSQAKPLESHSMCVHPKQVKEANERMSALGLTGCYYKPNGILEFTSRGNRGRKGFNKMISDTTGVRFVDQQGGYGDG